MAELGTSIMKMAPQLMQAGGSIATAMGQPEIGAPLSAAGTGMGMAQGGGGNMAPGASATQNPMAQGLGTLAGIAQKAMGGGQQPQNAQQPPPMRPMGGGSGGMPAPMQQMGMGAGQMQPPQAAGASAGGGMGTAQNPQYAAMIRQLMMGGGGSPTGMG